jgi:hypothetical protein
MLATYLQYVVILFAVLALLLWTASAFVNSAPAKSYMWAWGCVAVAAVAQLFLLLLH